MLNRMFVQLACVLGVIAPGALAWATRDYRPHEGYVESTLAERGTQSSDLQLIDAMPSEGPSLQDQIFNAQLTHEFQEKYNDKFGRTDAEHIFNSPEPHFVLQRRLVSRDRRKITPSSVVNSAIT